MTTKQPETFLPLSRTNWYILAALVEGPKHGYAIIKDIETRSEGDVRPGIGNLYIALKRLLDQGLIERADDQVEEGERRKTYRLSGLGERVWTAEQDRLAKMMRGAPKLRPAGQGV